jgi:serine/threonine protein phosphatase PrpC
MTRAPATPAVAPTRSPTFPDQPQAVSLRGARPEQEDRFLILRVERRNHPVIPEHGWLMAVMDGHGGPQAATAVEKRLPGAFQRAFKECRGQYRQVMSRAVAILNEDPEVRCQISAGTTLSMVYVANNLPHVYVAHLGDSPVILFDGGGNILFRTEEHNIITNPREVEIARQRCVERHGVDRIAVAEVVTRNGHRHMQYLKDRRMDEEFEAMSQEILDQIEALWRQRGQEYPIERLVEDGKMLTRIMRGKGVQNIAQLGALPFDAILSREPDVAEVLVDLSRLPIYVLLATDGILDVHRGAPVPEIEKEIAHAVAVEHATAADLVRRAGGDQAPDNTTVVLYRIAGAGG